MEIHDSGIIPGTEVGQLTLENYYHNYGEGFSRERAQAWLIAYWYERKLGLYPNLNFRNACMEAINAGI